LIDAHVHLWQLGRNGCRWPTPDLAPIHRDFSLGDLRPLLAAAGVEGIILVQSQEDGADTDWLLGMAADALVLGVVGWVDFEAADAVAGIERLAGRDKLCALRPMVQDRAAEWYDDPGLDAAFAAMAEHGLVLDALVRPAHLPALLRLAERHPQLDIVIDHAAKPDFHRVDAWSRAIEPLSARPNVACKYSGLLTEVRPDHCPDEIDRAFHLLWSWFGADRLIWGSDWPVLNLAGSYAEWLGLAGQLVPRHHHAAVFGGNARWIYGLADQAPPT
jgi:L-fuconolactonase